MVGLSQAIASAFAMLAPTSSAPARPGPCVNAIASMSPRAAPASVHHLFEQRQRAPDVIARRQFRHDAAVLAMHRDLRMQRVRKQAALRVVEREAGFVAGAFDAEN